MLTSTSQQHCCQISSSFYGNELGDGVYRTLIKMFGDAEYDVMVILKGEGCKIWQYDDIKKGGGGMPKYDGWWQ